MLSKNQNKFGENSRSSLNEIGLMAPKPQRLQKNGGVRRNLMRSRNIDHVKEPQDVRFLEMSKNHQQSNWWPTNQPDATSYLQLPPRRFIDQRKQTVNYHEKEDLSWCKKCGEPGHIRAFCMARVFCSFCKMRSHSNKACLNQLRSEGMEPFSSSRQTTPIQNPIQQTQTRNYGEQGIQQNPAIMKHMEAANKPWENKSTQINHHETEIWYGDVPYCQNHYQKTDSKNHTSQETNIPQQLAQNDVQQKKIIKAQVIQVNETSEDGGVINGVALKRPAHQESIEERYLQREPFFVNHYYSHPVGQCCCQQHAMSVKERQISLQSSTTLNHEKSENSREPQKFGETKTCNNIMYLPTYDGMDEQGETMLQYKNRNPVVEPRIHLTQPSIPDQVNTVLLYAVDTTNPPPLMTKKEKEEFQTNTNTDMKMQQKDGDLLNLVQTVAKSLQQQIVLGIHTADMSQQCMDALIGELIKSHNRRDMDNVLSNIPTFNGLEPEKCIDWATRI